MSDDNPTQPGPGPESNESRPSASAATPAAELPVYSFVEDDETLLRFLAASAAPILISRLPDGVILECNEAFLEAVERKRAETIGTPALWHYGDPALRMELIHELQDKGRVVSREIVLRRGPGKRRYLLSVRPILFGGVPALLSIAQRFETDSTESEDSASLAAARETERLGSLAAGLAHGARNPIFGLMAGLDALEARHGLGAEQRPMLDEMRSNLNRLNELVRDVVEFSRPEKAEQRVGSLGRVVEQAASICRAGAADRGVEVETLLPADDVSLPMDHGRLVHALQAIIDTATQSSPKGTRVRVKVDIAPGGQSAICQVEDSGPGFSAEALERAFDPFYTARSDGTGMGLAVAHRIVHQHGGDIELQNRPDRGAVVRIELPISGSFAEPLGNPGPRS